MDDDNPYAFYIDELLNDDHSHNCFENNNNQFDELLLNNDDGHDSHQSRYELLNVISKGSYGIVYRAQDMNTGEIVAVKHEFHGLSRQTLREIRILKSLPRHPCIVQFKETIVEDRDDRVFVVMEYVENDLKRLMDAKKSRRHFTLSEVKCLMKQLLEGLAFLHENGVMHRDLKPSNILINQVRGELKICDFGLSRYFGSKASGSYTPGLVTLWYRAPELLLGAKEYSRAIDMWSVGCIMAELLLKEVLFQGNSEIQQLESIYMLLGTPDITCPGFSSIFRNSVKRPYNHELRLKFATATYFDGAPLLTERGFDLLEKLLTHDPHKRITARAALDHDWFKEYYGFLNLTDI